MLEAKSTDDPQMSFLSLMVKNRAGLWTTALGVLLILLVWQHSFVALVSPDFIPKTTALAHHEAVFVSLWLLGGFAPAFLVVVMWRRVVEQRKLTTLFTALPRFRWRLAVISAFVVAGIGLVLTLIFDAQSVLDIKNRAGRFSARDWLLLIAAYGIGISIQASFEEVFVRGWLLQHVARAVPSAAVAIIITSVFFAALHFRHHGWATYAVAFAFGLAFGWSAYRLNGLEAAIGAHISNNLIGALLAGQMITGNEPMMDANQIMQLILYVLGFLLFVEVWARFFENPSRD